MKIKKVCPRLDFKTNSLTWIICHPLDDFDMEDVVYITQQIMRRLIVPPRFFGR
jgi:hypothetical protein